MDNKRPLIAHLCLFCSGAFWGLMAPVGKDAMMHGIDGIDLVSFRVLGGAILFGLPPFSPKKRKCLSKTSSCLVQRASSPLFSTSVLTPSAST